MGAHSRMTRDEWFHTYGLPENLYVVELVHRKPEAIIVLSPADRIHESVESYQLGSDDPFSPRTIVGIRLMTTLKQLPADWKKTALPWAPADYRDDVTVARALRRQQRQWVPKW